jgi:hypothetical protein
LECFRFDTVHNGEIRRLIGGGSQGGDQKNDGELAQIEFSRLDQM